MLSGPHLADENTSDHGAKHGAKPLKRGIGSYLPLLTMILYAVEKLMVPLCNYIHPTVPVE